MWMNLAIAAMLYSLGSLFFGHFEIETPPARRFRKWVVFLGLTALLSLWVGQWALVWVFGVLAAGTLVHFVWCGGNGINPFTAEPRERYYRLRGWR